MIPEEHRELFLYIDTNNRIKIGAYLTEDKDIIIMWDRVHKDKYQRFDEYPMTAYWKRCDYDDKPSWGRGIKGIYPDFSITIKNDDGKSSTYRNPTSLYTIIKQQQGGWNNIADNRRGYSTSIQVMNSIWDKLKSAMESLQTSCDQGRGDCNEKLEAVKTHAGGNGQQLLLCIGWGGYLHLLRPCFSLNTPVTALGPSRGGPVETHRFSYRPYHRTTSQDSPGTTTNSIYGKGCSDEHLLLT